MEIVERLPVRDTVRKQLFNRSKNQCAYTGCALPIVDPRTTCVVGQIAHIEAANSKGPRFNEKSTNEQRRAYTNLILLCYGCHRIIDLEVADHPVEMLRDMKQDHEGPEGEVLDVEYEGKWPRLGGYPLRLDRLNRVLGWGHNDEEMAGSLAAYEALADSLTQLTGTARDLFAHVVVDCFKTGEDTVPLSSSPVHTFAEKMRLELEQLRPYFAELDDISLLRVDDDYPWLAERFRVDNEFVGNIASFVHLCEDENLNLYDIFRYIQFDALDE